MDSGFPACSRFQLPGNPYQIGHIAVKIAVPVRPSRCRRRRQSRHQECRKGLRSIAFKRKSYLL